MPKLTDEKIKQIIDLLDRSDKAINNLERANSNKMIYPQLKSSLQKMHDELKSRYDTSGIKLDEDD